jgi:hypothetical protein
MASAVSGGAAVGAKVTNVEAAAQLGVMIVTGPGLLPLPVPLATTGGSDESA